MCLFTHFAAGALAGGATGNVYAGTVAGLASHALLDMIPHYDHPDWRLELGAGMAALLLLLLLPFGSGAAVAGGIAGMLPDLENLFQKLGWMGRNRFVFPTHTGLLPHGRTLQPRSLVWQLAIFVACFGLLGLIEAPPATAAPPEDSAVMERPAVTLLTSSNDRTVVRVEFPVSREPLDWANLAPDRISWGLAAEVVAGGTTTEPPSLPVSLAVPSRRAPQVLVRDVSWWREPDRPVAIPELIVSSWPALRRGVPICGVEVPAGVSGGVLAGLVLEFLHPADRHGGELLSAAARVRDADAPRLPPVAVVNPGLHETLVRGAHQAAVDAIPAVEKADPAGLFGLTGNWLRLYLTDTGLYRLTGSDLEDLGVPVGDVDPDKLRLYRGGGLQLADDPETPDADQSLRVGLNEVAIDVMDGGDGEWNLADEMRFYGVGTSTWRDRLQPGAQTLAPGQMRLEHYDHAYAAEAIYWLTWENDALPSSPLPGAPRRVIRQTVPAGAGPVRTSGQVRTHIERQRLNERGLVADHWVIEDNISTSRYETFQAHRPVPGAPARFVADVRAAVNLFTAYTATAQLNVDQAARATTSFYARDQKDSLRCRVIGTSTMIQAGSNTVTAYDETVYGGTGKRPELALDCFDVMYEDELVLEDGWGSLAFGLWADEVTVPTGVDLRVSSSTEIVLWDVTVPDSALVLVGTPGPGETTFGLTRQPGLDRHFLASRPGDLRGVTRTSARAPVVLKVLDPALDYIVLAPTVMMDAAQNLADYRSTELPGIATPVARAVDLQDVYDNFSGGQKDAFALRNYLRWTLQQGGDRLTYVCFLGNASSDPRNYAGGRPLVDLVDLTPTCIRTGFPRLATYPSHYDPYATDDALVSFDTAPPPTNEVYAPGLDLPDLACGRLPALNQAEARAMVDRTIAYEQGQARGPWCNRILLAADDTMRPGTTYSRHGEIYHTQQADLVAEVWIPNSVEVVKVFAVEYPFPPGSAGKPAANRDIVATLDGGTTIYYYVGHGSEDKLGDEGYFYTSDIANLVNSVKRTVFMAFSCDVGVYDSHVRRSMAEEFVASDSGGAVAAVCASQVSWINSNNALTDAFYQALYPGREVSATATLGGALLAAKSAMGSDSRRSNSQRYNIMGDPALHLPNPEHALTFVPDTGDTLRPGHRQEVAVASQGAGALLGAGDGWDLRVEESAHTATYYTYTSAGVGEVAHFWTKYGGTAYRGTGIMDSGDLRVPFKTPSQSRTGDRGRVRMMVDDGRELLTAVMTAPVVRSPLGTVDDVIGPAITMGFEDGRYRVTPGTVLAATLADTSSIALLGTAPGNSISLEFDDSDFLVDVTGTFAFEANSHQRGSLEFPLPADLELGEHTVEIIAADALGNVSSDSLSFEMVTAGAGGIYDMTLFPNPTPGPCRLIFELSDPMEVQWDIYTVAGRRIITVRDDNGGVSGPGPTILEWDGRDAENDELANGTYIYVLRGVAGGRDGRDLVRTGKLVIMR